MNKFLLVALGIVIGIIYWVERIVCFPIDLLLKGLSYLFLKLYQTTPDEYFSILPRSKEEVDVYYKKAEEQYKKCKCDDCKGILDAAKLLKEVVSLAEEKREEIVKEKEEVLMDEVKCLECGTNCVFNTDTRIYECPKCNKF